VRYRISGFFWLESNGKRASYATAEESLDFETHGERNGLKSEDTSELRKGSTRTRLHQKKLIAPSCDIGFPSFSALIERQEIKLSNGRRKFGF
jgi:hypothetical protein